MLEFHCVVYQWIRLNKLYNLMESFLQMSELFFELTKKNKMIVLLGLCKQGGGGICVDQHAVLFFTSCLKKVMGKADV